MVMADPTAQGVEVSVLTHADLHELGWVSLHDDEGIEHKILWQSESGGTIVGLMRLQPGTADAGHAHPAATQHAWVIEGNARVAGRDVGPGSYVFVPPGAEHHTAAVGSQACTIFYVYQPFEPLHGEHRPPDDQQ
jgi:quercetin dioxygenase-like cupin family protein